MTKSTNYANNTVTDQSSIPRPLNCFLMYRLEKQKEIVAKCSGANHRDISKIIAKWWQEASEEEKRPFRERARIAKMEHRKLYPDYKYTPKKKVTPKRVYIRKNKKEKFTSRAKENNAIMEMIYKDPNALESINERKPKSDECAVVKSKKTRVSKKIVENTVVMAESVYEEVGDEIYHDEEDFKPKIYQSTCNYATSISSCQTVPDFNFDSQATSPFTDSYSEADIPSPYVEQSSFDFNMGDTSLQSSDDVVSPYSVLDSPFINESNAYSCMPLAEQLGYFQLNHSIMDSQKNNTAEEFRWNEIPFVYSEQYQNSVMMQMSQPVQYINPAMLHM